MATVLSFNNYFHTRQPIATQAREACPDIVLVRVPEQRDKADLSKYRAAGREVIAVLAATGATVERASIDEAYLDLSQLVSARLGRGELSDPALLPNTHIAGETGAPAGDVAGWLREADREGGPDLRLAVGCQLMEEVRAAVFATTGFRCSAGISHCKTLAKLCCGLNKPNKQTVLPQARLGALYATLRCRKVRGLGGKLGAELEAGLGVETMAQLAATPLSILQATFDPKIASWLAGLGRGRDGEQVKERELPQSIGCGKNFRGREALDTRAKVELRLTALVEELVERLEADRAEHGREAAGVTVSAGLDGEGTVSRAGPLHSHSKDSVYSVVFGLLCKLNTSPDPGSWQPPLTNLSLSAGKFSNCDTTKNRSITAFFSPADPATAPPPLTRQPLTAVIKSSMNIKQFLSNASDKSNAEQVEQEKSEGTELIEFSTSESSNVSCSDEAVAAVKPAAAEVISNEIGVDISELLPSLSSFSPSLLADLPPQLRRAAKQRLVELQQAELVSSKPDIKSFFSRAESTRDKTVCKESKESETLSVPAACQPAKSFFKSEQTLCDITQTENKVEGENTDSRPAACYSESFFNNGQCLRDNTNFHDRGQTRGNANSSFVSLGGESKPPVSPPTESFFKLAQSSCENSITKEELETKIKKVEEFDAERRPSDCLPPEQGVEQEENVECEQCGRLVSPFTLPEHLDWHFALGLARGSALGAVKRPGKPLQSAVPSKKARRSADISAFFKKSGQSKK